jgi:SAM-dependent methyltransferase
MAFAAILADKIRRQSEHIERARAEFNYHSIKDKIIPGSKVLDVGAWACYLGELLRDRLGCEVMSLDVVDTNKTELPFQLFDGRTFPIESSSFDVVLMLYVLHHADEDEPLLREATRVLRENGRVLVAEDRVDGFWNRVLTYGFHIWLWLITRMSQNGTFRTVDQWRRHFPASGFNIKETIPLGHHLGRSLWPNNILFVLEKPHRESAGVNRHEPSEAKPVGVSH